MNTRMFRVAAVAVALLAPTVKVEAGDFQFVGLTEMNRLAGPSNGVADSSTPAYSRPAFDQMQPVAIGGCGDSADCIGCCCGAQPRIELSAALLFLQPGSGSLEYGTLVNPLPAPTPHWNNQSIIPSYAPAFNVGMRYFVPDTSNDVRTSWTHLNSTSSGSFAGTPLQFAGPSFLIGPGATAYNLGAGSVTFRYDAVNLEAGHLWRDGRPFQVRVFGGMQYANITQNITGSFADFAGTNSETNTTNSKFNGAGPRAGVSGQFNWGNFAFLGDMAAVALIGRQQSHVDFNTFSALFPGGNPQYFASPNGTQVVPGLDTRLGGSYTFPFARSVLKFEAGYQAIVYLNAINSYSLTQVATPPVVGAVGVFFATADHLQNNFTAHGPYISSSWSF